VLSTIITGEITLTTFLICTGVSLLLGICTALLSMFKSKYSQSFVIAIAILPTIVQVVIMMVNGNIGAGVAVAGAFSLVRFRSAPGTAKDIIMIFFAMAIGLATGMGYVGVAVLFFAVVAIFSLILSAARFGGAKESERQLKITVPENLDYEGLFDDILEQYASSYSLDRVKTSNMGTLYELQYRVTLKGEGVPKAFLDELRCRNGNLNISCGRVVAKEAL